MIRSQVNYYFLLILTLIQLSCNEKKEAPNTPFVSKFYDFEELIGKDYLIDDQHSYLGFKIKYFGYSPVRGRFNEFDGTVFYDTSNITSLSTTLFIDIKSINTGNDRRDNDLKSEGTWFDVAHYPYAIFRSRKVVKLENDGFELVGDLTIKDSTKAVTFKFEKPTRISRDWAKNEQIDFEGTAIINRQDFGVYGGDFWSSIVENGLTQLSDEVELELNIHCRRADYFARYEDMDSTDVRKLILEEIQVNGFDKGMEMILESYSKEEVSLSGLSTIGYTLDTWKMHADAIEVFNLKMRLGGASKVVFNQLGISHLSAGNNTLAKEFFLKSLEIDSVNSRSSEYLRLMNSSLN
ncbi:YceI family protein [Ekhidna sp.]|uniref:YceI family protein n=1 Tax=Ekhidna sp. TaxID=2608089 RepID=UPI0032972175